MQVYAYIGLFERRGASGREGRTFMLMCTRTLTIRKSAPAAIVMPRWWGYSGGVGKDTEGRVRVLDHERLEVYQVARELSREIARLRRKMGSGRPDMVDQILRAAGSVPLNIAEGSGERLPRRRAYFYRVARSSATEVASGLDHLVDMEILQPDDIAVARRLLVRIVSMLVKLADQATASATSKQRRRSQHPQLRPRTRTSKRARTPLALIKEPKRSNQLDRRPRAAARNRTPTRQTAAGSRAPSVEYRRTASLNAAKSRRSGSVSGASASFRSGCH